MTAENLRNKIENLYEISAQATGIQLEAVRMTVDGLINQFKRDACKDWIYWYRVKLSLGNPCGIDKLINELIDEFLNAPEHKTREALDEQQKQMQSSMTAEELEYKLKRLDEILFNMIAFTPYEIGKKFHGIWINRIKKYKLNLINQFKSDIINEFVEHTKDGDCAWWIEAKAREYLKPE